MLDTIQKHREQFAKDAKPYQDDSQQDNNVFGGLIFDDNTYYCVGRWVCHGFLNEYNYPDVLRKAGASNKKLSYVLSAPMESHATERVTKAFYDWLINRSPWAHIYLDKDVDRCMALGFVVDASVPANVMMSGLMASRFMTEAYYDDLVKRIPVYIEILKAGFTEDEAFLFSHIYSNYYGVDAYPLKFSRYASGHSPFHASKVNEEYYRNFLQHKMVFTTSRLGKGGYSGDTIVCDLWGSGKSRDALGEWALGLKPISGDKAINLNIFKKNPPTGYMIKDQADLKSILNQFKERIYA